MISGKLRRKHSNRHLALKLLLPILAALNVSVSQAEYFGSPNGRTANFSTQPQLSVEAGFSSGNFESADYQQISVRLNYQYTPKILLFGDIGQTELNSESELSFGLGGFYSLSQPVLWSEASAVKVSLHQVSFEKLAGTTGSGGQLNCAPGVPIISPFIGDLDFTPAICTITPGTTGRSGSGGDIRNIGIELLMSGTLSGVSLGDLTQWYANGGIQMLNGDIADDTVLGFGAGLVFPLDNSEAYGGFDYADEVYFGIGYRYFVD